MSVSEFLYEHRTFQPRKARKQQSRDYRHQYGTWRWLRYKFAYLKVGPYDFRVVPRRTALRLSSHPECVESYCGRWDKFKHRCCDTCGDVTCQYRLIVDGNKRRKMRYRCTSCFSISAGRQYQLREERVLEDWKKVTRPINPKVLIVPDEMPDQYAGRVRDTIRAFLDSGSEFATVPELPAGMIQRSIDVLGLSDEVYVEQRDNAAVIRRIEEQA